ncbi:MAG TPA: hypothetical protein VHR66_05125 [Gemmataceae bacterium]|jgi:hypothetical protein|nr:hypothetical protein [Gemmataceae bacterium]
MRPFLSLAAALAFVIVARADTKDPLRFFPETTDIVVKVEKPRLLAESVLKHDLAKEAMQLQVVRDFLDNATYRRFFQLVAHFEHELGSPWPELIDKLAGGGMALGAKFSGDNNAPVVIAVQGTDEKTVTKFFNLAVSLLEEERTRQGAGEPMKHKSYEGFDGVELDKDAIAAHKGDVILFSNKGEALKSAIDHYTKVQKDPKTKTVATIANKQSSSILPAGPAAWLWLNLKPIKELPQIKDLFEMPRANFILTFVAAGQLDVARRSDFLTIGLYADKGDFRVAVRMPAGRDGMATDVELHLPKDPKIGGTLPLLEPQGVLASHSFYLDLDTMYKKREQIFPPDIAKGFAEGEQQISRFLINSSLPEFLSQSGVHYRLVAARHETVPDYKTEPEIKLPAFAAVISMRNPKFAKTMSALIHAGSAALAQQVSYKSWDEEIAGVPAFGYTFREGGKFPDDPQNLHLNYQPTFGAYKDQYILASNKGLFKELVGILEKEDRTRPMSQNMQARAYASGAGDFAGTAAEAALASTIVGQALKVGDARKQTEALFKFLPKLGTVGIETDYTANEFRLDITWKTKK